MSCCKGCGGAVSTTPGDEFLPADPSGGRVDWMAQTDGGASPSAEDIFLSMTDAAAAGGEEATWSDELDAVALEDELAAAQELSDAMGEAGAEGVGQVSLDELLAIAKSRPGLKITFSY